MKKPSIHFRRNSQEFVPSDRKLGTELGFGGGPIEQHDWNIISHWENPVTLSAFQSLGISAVFDRLPARRTNQSVQELFRNHNRIVQRRRQIFVTSSLRFDPSIAKLKASSRRSLV
jgi:hypothetical protein